MKIINSTHELLDYIKTKSVSAIVVEGYDGVGKGKVLDCLASNLDVVPYRPDYNLWQKYDHRKIDRWKVSGFFWDIFSHFGLTGSVGKPMLFDRGVISGAVYGHDISIAETYKEILRDTKVLHILVTCNKEDFVKFQKIRNPDTPDFDIGYSWKNCELYTEEYLTCFDIAGVDYIVYDNKYSERLALDTKSLCKSCGHYNYGFCRHPKMNCEVDPNKFRCKLSNDKETQDIEEEKDGTEMHCLQS